MEREGKEDGGVKTILPPFTRSGEITTSSAYLMKEDTKICKNIHGQMIYYYTHVLWKQEIIYSYLLQ